MKDIEQYDAVCFYAVMQSW